MVSCKGLFLYHHLFHRLRPEIHLRQKYLQQHRPPRGLHFCKLSLPPRRAAADLYQLLRRKSRQLSGVSPSGAPNISVIRGYSAIEIIRYYYGNDMYINAAQAISGVPSSWPGYDLTIGASGTKVRQIQEQLNRIAQNYPAIRKPLPTVSSVPRPLHRCGLFSVSSTSRQPESWIIRPGIRFQTFMWQSAVSQSLGRNGRYSPPAAGRASDILPFRCSAIRAERLLSYGKAVSYTIIKNVPWHILAPGAVALATIYPSPSAHPRGAFLSYGNEVSHTIKKTADRNCIFILHAVFAFTIAAFRR